MGKGIIFLLPDNMSLMRYIYLKLCISSPCQGRQEGPRCRLPRCLFQISGAPDGPRATVSCSLGVLTKLHFVPLTCHPTPIESPRSRYSPAASWGPFPSPAPTCLSPGSGPLAWLPEAFLPASGGNTEFQSQLRRQPCTVPPSLPFFIFQMGLTRATHSPSPWGDPETVRRFCRASVACAWSPAPSTCHCSRSPRSPALLPLSQTESRGCGQDRPVPPTPAHKQLHLKAGLSTPPHMFSLSAFRCWGQAWAQG